MKSFNIYLSLLFVMFFQTVNSQEVKQSKTNKIDFKPYFNVGFIYPIEFGNTASSACGYINHGLVLTAFLRDVEDGYRFCQLALNLTDRLNSREFASRSLFIFANWIQHRQLKGQGILGHNFFQPTSPTSIDL